MNTKKLLAEVGVLLCKVIVFIYDVVTLPVYFVIDRPWEHWKLKKIVWSKLEQENDPYSSYVRQVHRQDTHVEGVYTMNDLFKSAVTQHGDKPCFGTREVLGEEEVASQSGKVFKKLSLGEYKWMTYNQADSRVEEVSKGLLSIGIKSRKPVVLLAETRVEWIITAQACFRINVPVVTLYATLGEEGMAHGINETEVTHIITSVELLPKLKKIFDLIPRISNVVYMEASHPPDTDGIPDSVQLMSFAELTEKGKNATDYSYDPPSPEDLAILMYTSGSTGVPKGVMISNKNLISTIRGLSDVLGTSIIGTDNKYVAYLPLAHVLELGAECYLSSLGVPIGFSSPQTLTDFSTAVKKGCLGDLKVLQPTLMAAVPLMLDRIRKSILTLAGQEGTYSRGMFDFGITYKNFWLHKGFRTRKLDRWLMKTYSDFLGGRLHIVICGGAPVSPDTQNFIRTCLSVRVLQGYGMTETAACATVMDVDDFSTGRVGAPLSTCKVRLVDWDEGGYHVTDVPHPRGEIVVGGDSVTAGYYKKDALTQECFTKENGVWWIYTGDIGEVFPDGTFKIIGALNKDRVPDDHFVLQEARILHSGETEGLLQVDTPPMLPTPKYKPSPAVVHGFSLAANTFSHKILLKALFAGIGDWTSIPTNYMNLHAGDSHRMTGKKIAFYNNNLSSIELTDRKKDLVKLQFGEYVALGKVEAELKTCPLVENICVIGNGMHNYLVALVVPNQRQLSVLAKDLGKDQMTFAEMCHDHDIAAKATAKIRAHGRKCRLFGAELPTKIKLCSEEWVPDNGLVTAAFKLRRNVIQQHYEQAIDEMYSSNPPNGNTKSV